MSAAPASRLIARLRVAGLAIAVGLLSACVTNPVTGQREISFMSAAQERAAGAQAAEQVAAEIGLVDDPALTSYVDAIGQRMAQLSPRQDVDYKFAVADMPEPNAFALPGGWIYVSRGLLAYSNSEAELANVIGHEIGHVAARHSAQRQTRSVLVQLGTILGTVAAAAAGGEQAAQSVAQFGQVAGAGLIASYGRDQERQSDDIGQRLAAGGGWDPAAMADFFHTLEREELLQTGQKRMPGFLDSHPLAGERKETSVERARTLSVTPAPAVARSHDDFLRRLEGLMIGTDPAEGVFQDELFLHAGLDFALRFPEGWKTLNQKTAVAGQSPEGDAQVVMQVQGPTGDPREAARVFLEKNPVEVQRSDAGTIGGQRAYRVIAAATGQQGPVGLDLTWIAHPELTFRLTAMAPANRFNAYASTFKGWATSFRPLSRSERSSIHGNRLRIVTARSGETLEGLGRRTGNAWSPEQTAVANGLEVDVRLRRGQRVKIAEPVPYRP